MPTRRRSKSQAKVSGKISLKDEHYASIGGCLFCIKELKKRGYKVFDGENFEVFATKQGDAYQVVQRLEPEALDVWSQRVKRSNPPNLANALLKRQDKKHLNGIRIKSEEVKPSGEALCGETRLSIGAEVASVAGKRFFTEELARAGYLARNGTTFHAVVTESQRYSGFFEVVERLDLSLRQLSDMRRLSCWRDMPWLAPAIEAVHAERDRLTRETGIEHHVDHIHPVSHPRLCGLTVPWNLRAIPAHENLKKSNKLL